jgi:hypothetical protein
MKLKLTYAEFEALYSMLSTAVDGVQAKNLPEKLLLSILDTIYGKLYAQGRVRKQKYSLKFTDHEAIAFLCYYGTMQFEPTSFEGNLIHVICNKIKQHYA